MTARAPVSISHEDAERAVAILEATGGYRVMRRMPDWPAGEPAGGPGLAKVVILDTETTGLDAGSDKLIEVGIIVRYVDVQSGAFVGPAKSEVWLEDPGFALEPHTIALTGITDDLVRGKRFDEQAIARVVGDAALIIAHSARHDRSFMESRFPTLPVRPWGCTLEQVDWRTAGYGSSKLDYLLFRLGMFHDGHRALPDCQALGHVLSAPLPSGMTALQHVIGKSQEKDFKVHANGAPFEKKDELKGRDYFWDGEMKVWHRTLSEAEIDAEFEWLKTEIYQGRPAKVRLSVISAQGRFTADPAKGTVEEQFRTIGAQGDGSHTGASRASRYSSGIARRY